MKKYLLLLAMLVAAPAFATIDGATEFQDGGVNVKVTPIPGTGGCKVFMGEVSASHEYTLSREGCDSLKVALQLEQEANP